ncbi:MAG: ribonuclease E/G [Alphaproteobacteria bacterium]|nr:ribonuclease E/G [Alphaproteobacteria bacterium]
MRLVHSFSPFEEICVLFDQSDRPLEVSVWRKNDLQTGALYVAQAVRSVASGWFLDVGQGRSVYVNHLSFYVRPDGTLCTNKLTQGDRLIVRIVRPETAEKEAEASSKVTLPGQRVVLMPTQKTPSFSRQLDQETADRLKLLAPNEGVLFRTAARETDLENISAEINALKKQWLSLLSEDKGPGVLFQPIRDVFRCAEKYRAQLAEIVTDDASAAARLKKERLPVTFEMQGVWEKERMAEALDTAAAVRSALPSGGFLMTEQTAACVCFDVNAGSGGAAAANEEACAEILRQIRLKSLGGQMIIDFAGRKEEKVIRRLLSKLKSEKVFISGISSLGLVELTVEKTKRSVFDLFSAEQRSVRTAAEIIRRLWFASASPKITISASAEVLNSVRSCVGELEERLGTEIKLLVSETVKAEGIKDEKAKCV